MHDEFLRLVARASVKNEAEIEKVARYYFVKLDGDWYMTGLYSKWAKEYNGDVSFIAGKE